MGSLCVQAPQGPRLLGPGLPGGPDSEAPGPGSPGPLVCPAFGAHPSVKGSPEPGVHSWGCPGGPGGDGGGIGV